MSVITSIFKSAVTEISTSEEQKVRMNHQLALISPVNSRQVDSKCYHQLTVKGPRSEKSAVTDQEKSVPLKTESENESSIGINTQLTIIISPVNSFHFLFFSGADFSRPVTDQEKSVPLKTESENESSIGINAQLTIIISPVNSFHFLPRESVPLKTESENESSIGINAQLTIIISPVNSFHFLFFRGADFSWPVTADFRGPCPFDDEAFFLFLRGADFSRPVTVVVDC